jgi:hypothetical protein
MTPSVIIITYGFFATLLIAGVSIVIRNSLFIDKATKELDEKPCPDNMYWA